MAAQDTGSVTLCPRCSFEDTGRYCSQCGSEMGPVHPAQKTAKVFAGPFYEYFQYAKSFLYPAKLIDDIRSGKFSIYNLMSFGMATIAISALIEYFLPSEAFGFGLPPFLEEIAKVFFITFVPAVATFPIHMYLNRTEKSVTFWQFLLATAAVSMLYYPWIGLLNGILRNFGVDNPEQKTSYGTLYYYYQIYSLLYKKTERQVIFTMGLYLMGLFAIVVTGLIIFM